MAKRDTSEEQKYQPTQRRLTDLRRREGSVPRSQDLPVAVSTIVVSFVLLLTAPAMFQHLGAGFDFHFSGDEPFAYQVSKAIVRLSDTTMLVIAPVFAAALLSLILASVVDAQGMPLQIKALTPDFSHISPAEGLKRIFGLPSWINLLKSAVKLGLVLVVTGLVIWLRLNDMMWAPTCGIDCLLSISIYTIVPLMILGSGILLASAMVDLKLSRWVFRHENRMTETEMKRDRKEDSGDPMFRANRRQLGFEFLSTRRRVGIQNANLVVVVPDSVTVGLYFKRGETPAPVLVARGEGQAARELLDAANGRGLTVYADPELALGLMRRGVVGNAIPQTLFDQAARALLVTGTIEAA